MNRGPSDRRRSVAYVNHYGGLGGAEHSLLDLLAEVRGESFDSRVFLPVPSTLAERVEALGVSTVACRHLGRLQRGSPAHLLRAAFRLARGRRELHRRLAEAPPDLLHANSTSAALFSARAARALGIPLVWHVRDLSPLGRWAAELERTSSKIVVPSQSVRDLVVGHLASAEKVETVPNGIHCAPFREARREREAARRSMGLEDRLVVVSVGQIVAWKNYELLLQAAAIVLREEPTACFLVAGQELDEQARRRREDLREKAQRSGLAEAVRFLGPRDDVPVLLAAGDLYAHPAYPEPFGRAVVEALASGLPALVMAGDHGPAETVRAGVDGATVQPHTAEAFADAILALLGDRERLRSMGAAGQERATRTYDRALVARRCVRIYDEVLGASSRRGA